MVALRRSESSDFARLRHLLSKRVRSRLIDRLSLPVTASAADVLKEGLRIGERLERQMEEQIVNDLIIGDDKHHPFTLGLERTVHALCEERIWRMAGGDDAGETRVPAVAGSNDHE